MISDQKIFESASTSTTTMVMLLGAVIACSSSGSAPTNRALENLLDTSTAKEFNDQFYIHGYF